MAGNVNISVGMFYLTFSLLTVSSVPRCNAAMLPLTVGWVERSIFKLMMHIKNTLMLLDAAVNVYLQRKLLNNEISLGTMEQCAKDVLAYVEQERRARDQAMREQYAALSS